MPARQGLLKSIESRGAIFKSLKLRLSAATVSTHKLMNQSLINQAMNGN
jgi:hypothetical protein